MKDELISRQAAIDALTGWETEPLDEDIVKALENPPTITPTMNIKARILKRKAKEKENFLRRAKK